MKSLLEYVTRISSTSLPLLSPKNFYFYFFFFLCKNLSHFEDLCVFLSSSSSASLHEKFFPWLGFHEALFCRARIHSGRDRSKESSALSEVMSKIDKFPSKINNRRPQSAVAWSFRPLLFRFATHFVAHLLSFNCLYRTEINENNNVSDSSFFSSLPSFSSNAESKPEVSIAFLRDAF